MASFKKLVRVLEKELSYQEKFLALLVKERTAITKLNSDELATIGQEKDLLLEKARAVGEERDAILSLLEGYQGEQTKIDTVAAHCDEPAIRDSIIGIGNDLRNTVSQVRVMNDYNAQLIKSSLGLVLSTIAIFRGAPEADLPTYESNGKMRGDNGSDPAFRRSTPVVREA